MTQSRRLRIYCLARSKDFHEPNMPHVWKPIRSLGTTLAHSSDDLPKLQSAARTALVVCWSSIHGDPRGLLYCCPVGSSKFQFPHFSGNSHFGVLGYRWSRGEIWTARSQIEMVGTVATDRLLLAVSGRSIWADPGPLYVRYR